MTYHRFGGPGTAHGDRLAADVFGRQLDLIREMGRVMSLGQLLSEWWETGVVPADAMVVTIDDGHRDFYEWGYPELRRRGMAATLFVVNGFIDRRQWLWPDALSYALSRREHADVKLGVGSGELYLRYSNQAERRNAWRRLCDVCIACDDETRRAWIGSVLGELGVTLPPVPTREYEACSWAEVREMAEGGIEVGCHSATHPVLSRVSEQQLESEVGGAKEELESCLGRKVTTYCYPNGRAGDIDERVMAAVRGAGFSGAAFGPDDPVWEPYRVPRQFAEMSVTRFAWKLVLGLKAAHPEPKVHRRQVRTPDAEEVRR